MAAYYAAI